MLGVYPSIYHCMSRIVGGEGREGVHAGSGVAGSRTLREDLAGQAEGAHGGCFDFHEGIERHP